MFTAWNGVSALDRIFDDVMGPSVGAAISRRVLDAATDIVATENDVTFSCDVPGVKIADLELTVENRILTIQGARRYEPQEGASVVLGRPYGAFKRTFALADSLDDTGLVAQLADGVLTVRIPKHAKVQPRKIPIAPGNGGNEPKR